MNNADKPQYQRILQLPLLLAQKSHFLFGARSTGKSTLIRQQLPNALTINLLDSEYYYRLSANPGLLKSIILASPKNQMIVIDEVQRLPELLNIVHLLIETDQRRFLLTGSSARKLKSGQVNLLAGRAWQCELYPLVYQEFEKNFSLVKALRFGTLPQVYNSDAPWEDLKAYCKTYLYEEIQAESLVRKIPQFSRFLQVAALSIGEVINFAKLASDTAIAASTLKEHFQILEDTLIGFSLKPWKNGRYRKAISSHKFYFFDSGVSNYLAGYKSLEMKGERAGQCFEQWLINEIKSYLSYHRRDEELTFWRSQQHDEVDLVIGDHTAIEIKLTKKISTQDFKGLKKISEEYPFKNLLLISRDPISQQNGGIQCLHVKQFLLNLYDHAY